MKINRKVISDRELFEKSMEVIPILVDMEIAGYKLSTFEH